MLYFTSWVKTLCCVPSCSRGSQFSGGGIFFKGERLGLWRKVFWLERSVRVLTTDCLCCIGCSDLKLRYLSEWVGLRYTAESKWPLGERLTRRFKNGRQPSFYFSIVNWMEFSILFRCVKNSDNFDLFMITKVSSTYLFHKRGGSAKVSRARVSMSSMTKFATTDETGESPLLFQKLVCNVFHET